MSIDIQRKGRLETRPSMKKSVIFHGCEKISVEGLGSNFFYGCEKISVEGLGSNFFHGCEKICVEGLGSRLV